MTVTIHWRSRHLTDERLEALRGVLEANPGPEPVVVDVTGTGQRVRLPLAVDPAAKGLRRAIHEATEGACAILPPPPGEAPF